MGFPEKAGGVNLKVEPAAVLGPGELGTSTGWCWSWPRAAMGLQRAASCGMESREAAVPASWLGDLFPAFFSRLEAEEVGGLVSREDAGRRPWEGGYRVCPSLLQDVALPQHPAVLPPMSGAIPFLPEPQEQSRCLRTGPGLQQLLAG